MKPRKITPRNEPFVPLSRPILDSGRIVPCCGAAFFGFVALTVTATVVLALLAAPASPATVESSGCERSLADTNASLAVLQARVKSLNSAHAPETCTATRLYFLELVKARAVTALCKTGPDRERDRFDADVEQINETIAAQCG
jgi:hypothetical protein